MNTTKPPCVGIHFGRSTCAIGTWMNDQVNIYANDQGNRTTPAVVAYEDDGTQLAGEKALYSMIPPDRRINNIKELLGKNFNQIPAGLPYTVIDRDGKPVIELNCGDSKIIHKTPSEIAAAILNDLKNTAEAFCGQVRDCVITVPSYWQDSQRQAMKDAGNIAGFNVLRIINEPTSACIAYGLDKKGSREFNVVVVDLGSATLDVSVLNIDDGVYEVKSTAGADIGGDQMTERLAAYVGQEFFIKTFPGVDPSTIPARAKRRLWMGSERLKKALTASVSSTIELDSLYEGTDLQQTVSRARLENLCTDIFSQITPTIDRALLDAKLSKSDIRYCVTSGGCCRMPKVVEILESYFGHDLERSIHPEEVVAYGAAVQASILSGAHGSVPFWCTFSYYEPPLRVNGAGLYFQTAALPLVNSSIDVNIVDFTAKVTVTQTFENRDSSPVEATYLYPVDTDGAVCEFSVNVDGKLVEGVIKEKEEAKEAYDDAIAEGHGAYLLEEVTGEIFKINVGNMKPGSKATVSLTYVTLLTTEGDSLRFSLPTISCSKYESPWGMSDVDTPTTSTASALTQVNIHCKQASGITAIHSPTHEDTLNVALQDKEALATMSNALSQQFVLKIDTAAPHIPRTWIETYTDEFRTNKEEEEEEEEEEKEKQVKKRSGVAEGSQAVLASFYPAADTFESDQDLPCEIIFVVDRSGSMSGSPMKKVKTALQLFLKSLPNENVSFNIVGFGSGYEMLFPSSQAYTDESLAKAMNHVQGMEADLGGTEILEPLMAIFRQESSPSVPRQIILLTDGEVGNTQQVIEAVAKHSKTTRVFTLGIDAASKHLVNGVAHAGRGQAEFIQHDERMEGKVMRQLKRAMQRFLTEVKVDWGDLPVTGVAPQQFGSIYPGDRLLAFAFLDPSQKVDLSNKVVKFSARSSEGVIEQEARLGACHTSSAQVHTLAAKALISELEDAINRELKPNAELKDRVTELGLSFRLASRYTSFIAVEKRTEATTETMKIAAPEMTQCVGGEGAGGKMVEKKVLQQGGSNSLQDLLLIDVTPLSLNVAPVTSDLCTTVIPRNCTIPCKKETVLTVPVVDGKATLRVLEGERKLACDNNLLDKLIVDGLSGDTATLHVSIDIDANGIVNVGAGENPNHLRNHIVITNDKGRLSAEEIERMVREAEMYKDQDDKLSDRVAAFNRLESLIYHTKAALANEMVLDEQKVVIELLANDSLSWVTAQKANKTLMESVDINDIENRVRQLEHLAVDILGDLPSEFAKKGTLQLMVESAVGNLREIDRLVTSPKKDSTQEDSYRFLVETQAANGSWALDHVAGFVGVSSKTIEEASFYTERLQGASVKAQKELATLWATALAVEWLELFVRDLKEEWQLLAEKAVKYIKKTLQQQQQEKETHSPLSSIEEFSKAAKEFFFTAKASEMEKERHAVELKRSVLDKVHRLQQELNELMLSHDLLQLQRELALRTVPSHVVQQPAATTTTTTTTTATTRPYLGPKVEEVD